MCALPFIALSFYSIKRELACKCAEPCVAVADAGRRSGMARKTEKILRFAKAKRREFWRRYPDLNRGVRVLQTLALPLGYSAKK